MTFAELEFLVREEWREVLERNAVACKIDASTVYAFDADQRVVVFALVWRTDWAAHHVALLQVVEFDLLLGDKNIVGRCKIVIVR